MKYLLLCTLILPFVAQAQLNQTASPANYWQQQVDYTIEVSLNDTTNELNGFITMRYTNHSPQALNEIYMHLWPNAYRNQSTPLANQLLENGRTAFHFSKPNQRGYIDQLDFKLNAEACVWNYDTACKEICKLTLNQPLKTGESVSISTPFHVKLPETFSRLGHVGQSYQITQWYPKPAVYDKYGWHPIPYLDQGEFYSEYGNFDVSITLPENYVVGASGDLQDENEIKWLNKKAEETKTIKDYDEDMKFPPSSTTTKTLHYKQTNIHDFGWFADKRYHVLKGEVELPNSKRKVTTWAMFTNSAPELWVKAPQYLHDAIYYYSTWIGEYPYQQVTAVDGTISAGGGMEYPNITVIGEEKTAFALDNVITHEVGHNWFYGIIGSNERDHAWMDEGINSYYEYRYARTKYPHLGLVPKLKDGAAKFFDIGQYNHKYQMDLGYQYMARENNDQPIDITSAKFTDFNYGLIVYGKTMLIFDYMEAYLGTETFDKVMHKYFEIWQYKHPQPEDVRAVFEKETGKDLSWFFNDLLKTDKKIDYKIAKVDAGNATDKKLVELKNAGNISSPVQVSVLKKDSVIRTQWVEGFSGNKQIEVDATGGDKIQIDPQLNMPEVNRRNNSYMLDKLAHKFEKLRLQFIGSIENQNRTQVCFLPYFGWNNYDKTQVGIALYSPFVPMRKFNYLLVPAIGTGSKQFIGYGKVNYNFYLDKIQRLTIGVAGKRYSYLLFPKNLTLNKVEPFMHFEFKKQDPRSPYTHSLNLRSTVVMLDWINFDGDKTMQHYYVNEARYLFERNTTLHPLNVSVTLRQGTQFLGLWAEGNFKISYKKKNQGFFVRVFAGGFPLYTKPSSDINAPLPKLYLSTAATNTYAYWLQKDYMFDENFVDRNGRDKYLGRQVALTGGAFRSLSTFGSTNKFLASANFSSTILRVIPIRPFASTAVILNDLNKIQFAAEFGLSIVAIPNMIEIHLPLVATKNIIESQKTLGITKWYQRISFTLKLQQIKPANLVRQFI